MILSFWDDFSERCYDMLCLLQGCVLYTTKSYLLVIYILPTHLLGYHKACIRCCELRFYGCVPWYFSLPIVTLKAHNLCFKRHGSSTAWGAPNQTSWAQLETTGSHWFPCSVGVNSFYIVYPDVVSGTFHPALKKQAGTPRSTSFHQRLGRLKGDVFFVLLFDCFDVGMIHLRKMHWKCWSGWDGLI